MRAVPPQAIALIKQFEGFSPIPYADPVGIQTVGFGHRIQPGETFTQLTPDQGNDLLLKDAQLHGSYVTNHITVPLNDNQFSALTSLVFNLGTAPLVGTLGTLLNSYLYEQAAKQFDRWIYAGGHKLDGLVKRREAEQALFLTPIQPLTPAPDGSNVIGTATA